MTWITLTERRAVISTEGCEGVHVNEAGAIVRNTFHLRADIITEIVPGDGETIVRTRNGGQYVCAETALEVLAAIDAAEPPLRFPGRALG